MSEEDYPAGFEFHAYSSPIGPIIAIGLATEKPPWYLRFIPGGVDKWRKRQQRMIDSFFKPEVP